MSTEFYLHTDDGQQSELKTQQRRVAHRLYDIWLRDPHLFYVDEIIKKEGSYCDDDNFIHVGHVDVCREMYDLIREEPGLVVDENLINVLVELLKASHQKLNGSYYQNKTWLYPSIEEQEFRAWLEANTGKRLVPRVD